MDALRASPAAVPSRHDRELVLGLTTDRPELGGTGRQPQTSGCLRPQRVSDHERGMMSRIARRGKHTRMWTVGVGVLAFLAVSGGVAAARSDRSGNGPARDAQSIAQTTTSKAANTLKSPQPGRKPRPSPTTPTTSPTSSPTPTPTTSPSAGTDVQISLPGFVPNFRFGDVLVDEALRQCPRGHRQG